MPCPKCGAELAPEAERLLRIHAMLDRNTREHLLRYAESLLQLLQEAGRA